jgi:hypothetical protein
VDLLDHCVDLTCKVRYLTSWAEGRRLLQEQNIDIKKGIITYLGPPLESPDGACGEIVLEDSRPIGFEYLADFSAGQHSLKVWQERGVGDEVTQLGHNIVSSGRLAEFNEKVRAHAKNAYHQAS